MPQDPNQPPRSLTSKAPSWTIRSVFKRFNPFASRIEPELHTQAQGGITMSRYGVIKAAGGQFGEFPNSQAINSATDLIERACGKSGLEMYPNDGHFVQKTYTNEVYTAQGKKQERLVLRNAPVTYLIVTGNLTAGSASVTVTPNTGIAVGMPLYAIQGLFPQGTTVATVSSNGALTMSQPASVTQTGAVFEISGLISFQWRSGTPSNPQWTSFIQDQYELDQQGHSGIILARFTNHRPFR